ncbi:MAG TPA: hypothetical protein VG078_06125 [Acidimicrobiales bacterium]|nr:hypothetical protein [Acidimicrobiales bacterium]
MRARRSWAALAALTVVAGSFGGCGDGDGDGDAAPPPQATVAGVPPRQVEGAVRGLCEAREEAGSDVNSARASFYDHSHEPLHGIARALEPVDRSMVSRLLEAKEAVEAGLASASPGPSLTADVDMLLQATRASLARLSVPPPSCP